MNTWIFFYEDNGYTEVLNTEASSADYFLFFRLQLSTYLTAQANGMRYFPNLLQSCLLDFSTFCAY